VRIFKNRWSAKFARKEGIGDKKLIQAVKDANAGKIDADYGGGVIEQRIARPMKGNPAATGRSSSIARASGRSLSMGSPRTSAKT
jgi:hypothetical protein